MITYCGFVRMAARMRCTKSALHTMLTHAMVNQKIAVRSLTTKRSMTDFMAQFDGASVVALVAALGAVSASSGRVRRMVDATGTSRQVKRSQILGWRPE